MVLLNEDNIFYCQLMDQMKFVHKVVNEVERGLGTSKTQHTDYRIVKERDVPDKLLEPFFDSLTPQQKAKVYSLCKEWSNRYKN